MVSSSECTKSENYDVESEEWLTFSVFPSAVLSAQ